MNTSPSFSENQAGFTLIEMLISLAIFSIVIAATYTAFLSQKRTHNAQSQVVEMQQNLRSGFEIMAMELRMAGFNPSGNASDAKIVAATSNSIQITADLNKDGDCSDTNEDLTFALSDDGNNDGISDSGEGELDRNGFPISERIHAIEFYYTLADGTQLLTPSTSQLKEIQSIQVSILAVSKKPDSKFDNVMTYYPGSNSTGDPAGKTWGPFNDNHRRRLLTYNINCRNIGI